MSDCPSEKMRKALKIADEWLSDDDPKWEPKKIVVKALALPPCASIPREDAEALVRAAADLFDEETVHQIEVGSTGCVVRCAKLKAIRTALSNFRKKHPEAGK